MKRPTSQIGILLLAVAAMLAVSCRSTDAPSPRPATKDPAGEYARQREEMVTQQIEARGVSDPRVLAALRKVPRHEFVLDRARDLAYIDRPLPIENNQTISQPYIVALMTELAQVSSSSKVLEIGTGSGYQAAVLAEIVDQVYSIEIIAALAESARRKLSELGYHNVEVRHGDGYQGWPEHAPFDAIVVTAAPPKVPEALRRQLAIGGRMVIPVGARSQELIVIERTKDGFVERSALPVRFVPMTDDLR